MRIRNSQGNEFNVSKRNKRIKLNETQSITTENYKRLVYFITSRIDQHDAYRRELICRFEEIDKLIGGWEDKREASNREELEKDDIRENGTGVLPHAKLNIVLDRLNDALTSIMGILFPHHKPYNAVASAEKQEVANALLLLLNREAKQFRHYAEITKIVEHALRYNYFGGIVEWDTAPGNSVPDFETLIPGASLESSIEGSEFSGNRVTAIDPFNSGWDMHVNVEDVAREGEYFWEVRRENLFALRTRHLVNKTIYGPGEFKEHLGNLLKHATDIRDDFLDKTNEFILSEDSGAYLMPYTSDCRYHERKAFLYNGKRNHEVGQKEVLRSWLGVGGTNNLGNYGTAEVTRIYIRLNPKDFGLGKEDTIETWYFEIVADAYIIYAQSLGNANALMPIFLGTLSSDTSIIDKTYAEMIMPNQEISAKLISAHFQSALKKLSGGKTFVRKGVVDRGKVAKGVNGVYEVDSTEHDKPLSHHVYQLAEIPQTERAFDDVSFLQSLTKETMPTASGKVMTDLDRATKHQSLTAKYENSRLMNHIAALLDERAFSDMRMLMYFNEVSERDTIQGEYDPETEQYKTYDSSELLDVRLSVSNGLINIDRFSIMSTWENLINYVIQSGNVQSYDFIGILDHYSSFAGIETDLSQFRQTDPLAALPPEMKQVLAQLAQSGQLDAILQQIEGGQGA